MDRLPGLEAHEPGYRRCQTGQQGNPGPPPLWPVRLLPDQCLSCCWMERHGFCRRLRHMLRNPPSAKGEFRKAEIPADLAAFP